MSTPKNVIDHLRAELPQGTQIQISVPVVPQPERKDPYAENPADLWKIGEVDVYTGSIEELLMAHCPVSPTAPGVVARRVIQLDEPSIDGTQDAGDWIWLITVKL